MAEYSTHMNLSRQLLEEMRNALRANEWPIVVDAGYYTIFHGMEALNARECRDSYTFADAADILENVLAKGPLDDAFVRDYRHLFYFRRGTIYGTHRPSELQIKSYAEIVERRVKDLYSSAESSGEA